MPTRRGQAGHGNEEGSQRAEVQGKLKAFGWLTVNKSTEEFTAACHAEIAKWKAVVAREHPDHRLTPETPTADKEAGMARVSYYGRDDVPAEYHDLFEHSASKRGHVSHLFRSLLASPKVFRKRYEYSNALREDTLISKRDRELAVLTVGRIAGSEYEFIHHARLALAAGIAPAQIDALAEFETSDLFSDQDRAVMRYAAEVTTTIQVADATWDALKRHFDQRQLVELVLIVAWYNQTVRVLIPLQIELEADAVERYYTERARRG